ncbi:hypothetical protein [Paraglaciecola sp. L1A13]|uniref:hypothetical protein n=1 Tax=Paraglaciecola sp. L1A13 TaxID=2686359 RepID=UPI00131D53F5|nr:hypothetical protein [Paraglaciecola sp. L1A13]
MNASRKNVPTMLLSILMVMTGSFTHAEARPLIQEVLLVGDSWELTVDDKRDNLIIRGVKGRQTKNSTSTFNYQIVWGGHSGVLRAVTDNQNSSQFISLILTDLNGISQECRGYMAQNTTEFMAGSCGSKNEPGAWYAVRNNRELASTISTKANQEICDAKVNKCQLKVDRLNESKQNLSKQYLAANSVKNQCQSALKLCYQEQAAPTSQTVANKSFSSFEKKVNGDYYGLGRSKDKSDTQVQRINIPGRPSSGSDLENWLRQHNGALLGVAKGILNSADRERFDSHETQMCSSNIYCEMAFRQQVIKCALDLGC